MDAVHNRSLFKNKSRNARKKLAKMGGIMASSSELLQAGGMVTPPKTYPTNYFAGGPAVPLMQQATRFVGSKLPSLGSIGRTLGISDNSLAAGMSANPGLAAAATAIAGNEFIGAGKNAYQQLTQNKKEEVANIESKMALNDLVADVQSTLESGENISAEVAQQLIEQLMPGANEEDKKELLETTGTDTSGLRDLDEINKRIMDVAVAGTIGKSPEALNQAVLAGLQNYQQTALAREQARIAASGKTSGYTPERLRQQLVQQLSTFGEDEKLSQGLLVEVEDENGKKILKPGLTEEQWIMKMMTLGGSGTPTPAPATTSSDDPIVNEHKAANQAAKEAGQKTYTIGGKEYNIQ
jgi:hypothetical protein